MRYCLNRSLTGANKEDGNNRRMEELVIRNKVEDEKHLEIYGGWREDIGMKNVSARPIGLSEKADTAISCMRPRPTRRKKNITSGREDEDVAINMCPCSTTINSRNHIAGEICKEERHELEEKRKLTYVTWESLVN